LGLLLGSEGSEPLVFLLGGLETTVTELGGGIDELDFNLFGHPAAGSWEDGLTEDDSSLLDTHDLTSDEKVVVVDFTVVGETTHRGNVLLDGISSSGSVVGNTTVLTGTKAVDLLVDLGTGVVTLLTDARNRPFDGGGMPSTDTTDLAETSVSLTLELLGTESLDDTLGSLTLGNTNSVDTLVGLEDLTDGDLLLELGVTVVNLLSDVATVNLDFHDLGLVLSELELADLGGGNNTNYRAVLLDALHLSVDGVLVLLVALVLEGLLGESLLLGVHPVFVEAALDIVVKVGSPDSLEGTETTRSLDVTDHTDDLHGRALNDGAGVHDILLDDLLTFTAFLIFDDVGHASLVADKGSEVDGLGSIILGEVSYAASVVACSTSGHETQVAVTGLLVFTMRHLYLLMTYSDK